MGFASKLVLLAALGGVSASISGCDFQDKVSKLETRIVGLEESNKNLKDYNDHLKESFNKLSLLSNYVSVCTLDDLNRIRENLSGDYVLMNDIDCSETKDWNGGNGFEPIGCDTDPLKSGHQGDRFKGVFNGNGHKIVNLYINRPSEDYVGLFGGMDSYSKVINVGLENVNIKGKNYVGALAGFIEFYSQSIITNSYSTGIITGKGYDVGGLVGLNFDSLISNSYSKADVNGSSRVGGLVGYNYYMGYSTKINNSFATGNVNGTTAVGGLVGVNQDATINNSFATGNVNGTINVGGLVGGNYMITFFALLDNFYYNNHSGNPSVCVGSGSQTGCTAIQNNVSYFHNSQNPPMDKWDFENVWHAVPNGLPILKWQYEREKKEKEGVEKPK